ncbi:FolC bifunctional protein [Desulforamulus reducens MI-1]|uniref:tetrahydrofolate synthase n=1 Tax=Desulforamulus reducens (strain ATCC BAA-1160 / DSM 100696 / MI-1) TaxID=349161 RepID=A4J7K9_DESRM|nr:folylpolyglutamate synthase/dihydrofolate synthase family protein [Desulforamulus reducens]ABO51062.1 FolC bifunctional protein [Desulforamulus reducens MI-1]
MTYNEAINYLKSLTKFGMNLGLARIEELLRRLQNPHHRLNIVHIGGTNGKGSTTAMIANILKTAGYKTGMFTSPHLQDYTERFLINGQPIPQETLASLIQYIRPHLDKMVQEGFEHPTEFEVSTALALLYFAREETDFVALEVGLGGAIDSTNVVKPKVSVITNIAMDHMDYLGSTLVDIANVKAGIIKQGIPVVTAAEGEALGVIRQRALVNNSKLIQIGKEVTWKPQKNKFKQGFQEFIINGLQNQYYVRLPLLGEHQQVNAASAVAAVELLFTGNGYHLPSAVVIEGLRTVEWPGRLEIIRRNPTTILDGAHNHAGAIALKKALESCFPSQKIIFVLGMLADKERSKVVAELAPLSKAVVVTRSNNPRAGDWRKLADYVRTYIEDVIVVENVAEAINQALGHVKESEILCITGSLYMIAEARAYLMQS